MAKVPRTAAARRSLAVPGFTRTSGLSRFTGRTGDEMKFFDTSNSFSIDATAEVPATGQLNLIPQGNTESQRIGRRCQLRSIQIRWEARYTPGASTTGIVQCYIYLIQDTQANGAAAAYTDVFQNVNIGYALRNMSNSDRFRILKKWILTFNATAGVQTAFASSIKAINYYRKLQIPLEFQTATTDGSISTIKTNNLFLIAGSSSLEDDIVTVNGTTRVRYTDE